MRSRTIILTVISLGLVGCAEDVLSRLCINDDATFDIEEVSVLEDAMGEPGTHDAVIVSYDDSVLEEESTWRVSSVDVLVMIPESQFGQDMNGRQLTLEVFDANDPRGTAPYVLTQALPIDELDWESVTLTNPQVAIFEAEHRRAWWTFDFAEVIPEEGMQSTTFLVSVYWQNAASPAVGYSRYNRPCSENWTDYGDGFGWVLNSENGIFGSSGNDCNHPMFRVNVETRIEKDSCGPS